MKRAVIFLILFVPFLCKGQTEFAPIGAQWVYKKTFNDVFSGEIISEGFITINSKLDTTISGLDCRQIIVKEILMDEGLEFKDSSFICQSNDSIFQIKDEEFRLLFNFSLEKNDTLFVDSNKGLYYTIDSTYLTTIESKMLKTQKVSVFCGDGTFPFNGVTLIEQIGPIESSIPPLGDQTISYLLYPDYECLLDVVPTIEFICYTENSWGYNPENNPICELLTSNNNIKRPAKSNYFKIYPNPAKDVIFIENELNSSLNTYEIHSINGTLIYQGNSTLKNFSINLPQGISSGFYMLSIKNETIIETHLLVIE